MHKSAKILINQKTGKKSIKLFGITLLFIVTADSSIFLPLIYMNCIEYLGKKNFFFYCEERFLIIDIINMYYREDAG